MLIIISGPSGVGKGTIISEILTFFPSFKLGVSACTRDPRVGEIDGEAYYFLTEKDFLDLIEKNAFLEWCKVHNQYYGTLKSEIDGQDDILLEIDTQGARKIRHACPESKSVFIAPPTLKVLRDRLEGRNTEKSHHIKKRLDKIQEEYQSVFEYDYVIINDQKEQAIQDAIVIIKKLKEEDGL
jgi:guanylate kinase